MTVLDMDMPSIIARWKRDRYEEDYEGSGTEERFFDATALAEAYVVSIDRQAAEASERAKPIDEEWLLSLQFTPDSSESMIDYKRGRLSVGRFESEWIASVSDADGDLVLLDARPTNRGDVLDLLRALKLNQ